MSSDRTVYIYEVADVINDIVDKWSTEVIVKLEEAQNSTINGSRNYAKRETTTLSYSDKKPYIKCYTNRKVGEHARALWNRKYQLSHLLEDGHKVVTKKGGEPKKIKDENRVPDTTKNHNKKVTSSMLTSSYDTFDETLEDYVKKKYIYFIKKKLGGI